MSSPVKPVDELPTQQPLLQQQHPSSGAITEDRPPVNPACDVDPQLSIRFHTHSQTLSRKIDEVSSVYKAAMGDVTEVADAEAVAHDLTRAGQSEGLETDVHYAKIEDLCQRFGTSVTDGLAVDQVAALRLVHGSNVLTPPRQRSYVILFLEQLVSGFSSILWLAAIVIFLSWQPLGSVGGATPQLINVGVAIVLLLVIFISAVFNFWQEVRSIAILQAFSHIIPRRACVIRGGVEQVVSADDLVVGDLVKISMGDKIPADLRLVAVSDLQVNNSALTGESEAVMMGVKCSSLSYLESTNLAFYSSLVVQGSGLGVVVSVGDKTVLGTISALTQSNDNNDTSLHREIRRFVLIISVIALFTGVITFIMWGAWLFPSYPNFMPVASIVMNAFSLIVAYVPEGLPVCVTLTLTLIAKRMYKQRVLVKNLAIIETFNSVSVIASDKTGTLTQNIMTVVDVLWGTSGLWAVPAVATAPPDNSVIRDIVEGAALCNNAESGQQDKELIGDAVDVALYKLVRDKLSIDVEAQRKTVPRVKVLPFNSRNKLMISMNERASDSTGAAVCYLKGAPEIILQYCSHVMTEAPVGQAMERAPLTDDRKAALGKRQEALGNQGFRVIGLAKRDLHNNEWRDNTGVDKLGPAEFNHLPNNGYTLLGMFALMDPPREEVPDAVLKSRSAGIRVAMVTGDHPSTATAIAKQVNIVSAGHCDKIRSLKLAQDEVHRPVMQIYEGGTLIESHIIGTHPDHSTLRIPSKLEKATVISKTNRSGDSKLSLVQSIRRYWQLWFGSTSSDDTEAQTKPVDGAMVVTGNDLKLFDDYLWSYTLQFTELVFARTSPEQKLRIVSELQARHEVVCVTGDGVNDSPALKVSDIGAALAAGAEVAHEAGDIILLNNDFTSIVRSIETGRLASDNLKKVCLYLLPGSTWSEMWPVMFNVFLGVPLSLSAFEMIILSVGTDVVDALALVQEEAEMSLMTRPPIDRRFAHMVDWRLLFHAYFQLGTICSFSAWFNYCMYFQDQGIPVNKLFLAWTWLSSSCCVDPNDIQCLAGDPGNCYQVGDRVFSYTEQNEINFTGQSIFFVSLIITNFFNMLATRTRYQSFFQHQPFYGRSRNLWLLAAICAGSLIGVIMTQVSWFNVVFNTRPVPVKYVAPAIGFGVILFFYDELRKWNKRNRPNSLWAKVSW